MSVLPRAISGPKLLVVRGKVNGFQPCVIAYRSSRISRAFLCHKLGGGAMLQFILASTFFLAFSAELFAQSAGVIEAAKKEGGKVVAYGSLESEAFDAVKAGFEKKTGLQLEYWRASGTKTMERAVTEYRSGKPLYDAILLNANVAKLVAKEGMLAKYDSPSAAQFPKEAVDPILGPSYRNVIIGVIYNRSMLSPADAPKTLEDLGAAQFKGKIAMPDPGQHV